MEDPALKEQVWAEHRHARKDLGVEGLPFFVLRLKGVEDVTKPRSFKHDEPTSSIVACIDELIAEHQKRQQWAKPDEVINTRYVCAVSMQDFSETRS